MRELNKEKCRYMAERGLTLVELLVVLAILIILSTLLLSVGSGMIERARISAFISEVRAIKSASLQYYMDTSQLPLKLEDLIRDRGVSGWRGPYLSPTYLRYSGKIAYSPWHTNLSITKCPNSSGIGTSCSNPDFAGTPVVEREHLRLVLRIEDKISRSTLMEIDRRLDDGDLRGGNVYLKSGTYLYMLLIGFY